MGQQSQASSVSISKQIREGNSRLSLSKGSSISFGLIIDDKSLSFALNMHLEDSFLDLAISCSSVICCRSAPKLKALVCANIKKGAENISEKEEGQS